MILNKTIVCTLGYDNSGVDEIDIRSNVFSDMLEGMICVGSPAKPLKPRV